MLSEQTKPAFFIRKRSLRTTLVAFLILTAIASSETGFAQDAPATPQKFVEVGLSTNAYKGDLSHSYSKWSGGYHIGILFNRKKRLNGHFNLMIGSVTAQNPDYFFDDGSEPQPNPNTFAKTSLITVNYDLHINLYKKNNFTVYLFQGIGLFRFDPRNEENKKLTDQLSTRARDESYSNITVFFPHGLGAFYTSKFGYGIGLQAGFLNSSSDYIDNVSKWGDRKKNDNVLTYKLSVYIPVNKRVDSR